MTRADEEDDDEPTPTERARAASLGRLVDGLLAGEASPPALDAEDRALLETAALIRAASAAPPAALEPRPVTPERVPRRPRPRWLLAGLGLTAVAAAAIALAVRPAPPAPVPEALRSRPLDALVGRIAPGSDATRRADLAYADRLSGYRQLIERSPGERP